MNRLACLAALLSACVAAVDGGPGDDGIPRRYATETDATAAQAPELLDESGSLAPPPACEGLLDLTPEEPALESDADTARGSFMEASAQFEQGDHGAALQGMCETYRLHPAPALLYNIAVIYERLGMNLEAVEHYEAFADRTDVDPLAQQIQRRIESLREGAVTPK